MAKSKNTQQDALLDGLSMDPNENKDSGESLIERTFPRAMGNDLSSEATATTNDKIKAGLQKLHEVPRFEFIQENEAEIKNKTKYFFGLFPIINRKTIPISKFVTLMVSSGIPEENVSGDMQISPRIGMVTELNDEQLNEALQRIRLKGLLFKGPGQSPDVITLKDLGGNRFSIPEGVFPLGRFCYFESVAYLNSKYPGGEPSWRNKNQPMRPLIDRRAIPTGHQGPVAPDMGDGWTGHWELKRRVRKPDMVFKGTLFENELYDVPI